jgi:hypothetical protein
MKKIICVALVIIGCFALPAFSADGTAARYEYAIVQWDGPDRLFYNLPGKFEIVRLKDLGITVPKEAHEEEFCLTTAANIMAKDGWEAVNLNSRRILFRRALK